ncbi:hypothetical protein R1flu_004450 [Riccia fluitans]|uniref:Uncharacterized protein n=1 Tax=Riccia fluitans TaxID=41844 RepID=A0ABD1YQB9_9MARC
MESLPARARAQSVLRRSVATVVQSSQLRSQCGIPYPVASVLKSGGHVSDIVASDPWRADERGSANPTWPDETRVILSLSDADRRPWGRVSGRSYLHGTEDVDRAGNLRPLVRAQVGALPKFILWAVCGHSVPYAKAGMTEIHEEPWRKSNRRRTTRSLGGQQIAILPEVFLPRVQSSYKQGGFYKLAACYLDPMGAQPSAELPVDAGIVPNLPSNVGRAIRVEVGEGEIGLPSVRVLALVRCDRGSDPSVFKRRLQLLQ